MIIAKKEFNDLISNWMMLFVLGTYLFFALFIILDYYNVMTGKIPGAKILSQGNFGIAVSSSVFSVITLYGAVIGIMIGCLSISNERSTNALNTLITKPLYRDTIINGKLLGSFIFLAFIIIITCCLITSALFVLFGNSLAPVFGDYLSRMLVTILFSLIYVMVFLSASVLISLLIKNQAFSMVISLLLVYVSNYLSSSVDAGNIASLFPGNESSIQQFIMSLSPSYSLWTVPLKLFNTSISTTEAFQLIIPDMTKFLIYIAITCTASYIIFVRRDVE